MKAKILFPEDYQYADAIGGCMKGYVESCTEAFAIVNCLPNQVEAVLRSCHPGIREDIADKTIEIIPYEEAVLA